MLDKLKQVEQRYLDMEQKAAQPDFYADPRAAARLLKEQKELEPVVTTYRKWAKLESEQNDLKELLETETDQELRRMAQDELLELRPRMEELEQIARDAGFQSLTVYERHRPVLIPF